MSYSTSEREVIGLCIALEGLNNIANYALLDINDVAKYPGEAEVRFISRVHQQVFLVRLLDFVKEGGDRELTGVKGSCLDVVLAACESKSFDAAGSIAPLKHAAGALDTWLKSATRFNMWLPTLEIDAALTIQRIEFLFILGNHVKHNLSRLTGVSKCVTDLLARHGYNVEMEQVLLALDDFREHLQEDYFVYYGTWLAELVNDVRWGVQDYLLPIFQQSYSRVPGEDVLYSYNFPNSITHDAPRAWFWRLMNHIRSGPYIKRFVGAWYMKNEILHE